MPRILSAHPKYTKKHIVKSLWEQFKNLDLFLKIMFVTYVLIVLSTPAIVLNYQIFKSSAQTDISEPSTQESQNNIYDFCSQFQNIEAAIKCEDALD
ncbi:hypothetical protein HYT32_01430, partial [Candidatus Roizmanbacteria bacterium]|nr:hypothetical protein [Candidatus Roizmanbacteria bacterium]